MYTNSKNMLRNCDGNFELQGSYACPNLLHTLVGTRYLFKNIRKLEILLYRKSIVIVASQ